MSFFKTNLVVMMVLLVTATLSSACYTTKVYTGAPAEPTIHDDRQWFLLAGLINLSDPAGEECSAGVAKSESEYTVADALIQIGLAIIGGTAGYFACDKIDEKEEYFSCISGFSAVPQIFGTRTVHYQCKTGS